MFQIWWNNIYNGPPCFLLERQHLTKRHPPIWWSYSKGAGPNHPGRLFRTPLDNPQNWSSEIGDEPLTRWPTKMWIWRYWALTDYSLWRGYIYIYNDNKSGASGDSYQLAAGCICNHLYFRNMTIPPFFPGTQPMNINLEGMLEAKTPTDSNPLLWHSNRTQSPRLHQFIVIIYITVYL